MRKCDVIVPVYNAYDCVVACVESVLKNTDSRGVRLILIDDKSTDERVLPMLEGFAKNNPKRIVLLKNGENLGFVKTVNKGMKYSKSDVLLLNSDTEVSEGWLEKIQECAYHDEMIATVTPLSNNATLASVPKMFEENKLPEGYDLARMAKLVEKCSMHEYPEIPTGHGFCLYIKRAALEEVGYFDEETFGKGYGEETDFSFRCLRYGYRHILCDDTYILHKESQSFLDNKENHDYLLEKKYPKLKSRLDDWNRGREISVIGDNIGLAVETKEDRPNILVIIHDFKEAYYSVGGTTLHVVDIINELRHKYNFHVLAPEGGVYKVYSFFKENDMITSIYRKPVVVEEVGFYSDDYEVMLEKVIEDYGISLVHVQHLMQHYFSVGRVCKNKKIKYLVSLHDYYLIEPEVSRTDGRVGLEKSEMVDLKSWRRECKKFLDGAAGIVAPSDFVKRQFEKVYKIKGIKVIEHGVDIKRQKKEHELSNKWNIAFIGAVGSHKGSKTMKGLTEIAPENLKIHLFGVTDVNIENPVSYVEHGRYEREQLPRLMKENQIDLCCILSLCPETYSYTVTEAVACGVPVLVTNVGAMQDRVEKYNLGWVIDAAKGSDKILEEIKRILSDQKTYEKVLAAIEQYKIKSVAEMAGEYDAIYKKYAIKTKVSYAKIRQNLLGYQVVRGLVNNDVLMEEKNRLEQEGLLSRNHIRNITSERDRLAKENKVLIDNLQKSWIQRLKLNPYSMSGKVLRASGTIKRKIVNKQGDRG